MTRAQPPRPTESLPIPRAGVNALPVLLAAQLGVFGAAAAVALVAGRDDADEIVGAWIGLSSSLGLAQALGLAWLAARLDRRLALRTPVARPLWLAVALPATALTMWAPLLLLTPVQTVLWLVAGRSRYADGAAAGLLAWAVVAIAAPLLWAGLRALRRATRTVPRRVHWTDTVPTGVVGLLWALPLGALPALGVVLALESVGAMGGGLVLLGWSLTGAVGAALSSRRLPLLQPVLPEVVGLALVAAGLPLFALGLVPSWGDHEDAHWAALAASCLVTWVGVGLAAHHRGLRHDARGGLRGIR